MNELFNITHNYFNKRKSVAVKVSYKDTLTIAAFAWMSLMALAEFMAG